MRQQRKRLCWAGVVKDDFLALPLEIQKDLAVKLFAIQLGGLPEGIRPCQVRGCERIEAFRGDTLRGVFLRQQSAVVQVLQVFQKTSRSGSWVPEPDWHETASDFSSTLQSREPVPETEMHSVDNVLRDLGFADAEELSAKTALAQALNERIGQCDLGHKAIAAVTGISPAGQAQLRAYHLRNMTLEQLIQALTSLGWQAADTAVRPLLSPSH